MSLGGPDVQAQWVVQSSALHLRLCIWHSLSLHSALLTHCEGSWEDEGPEHGDGWEPDWPAPYLVAKDGLELLTLLSPPECWNYRHVPAPLVYIVLGIEPRALCAVSKYFTS